MIKSGVIRDRHVQSIDGGKIVAGSLGPSQFASGERYFSDDDSIRVWRAYVSELLANGGVGVFEGAYWQFNEDGGLVQFDGPQVVFQDSVDFRSSVKLGQSTSDLVHVVGDFKADDDVVLGASKLDSTRVRGPLHVDDTILFGPAAMKCDTIPDSDVEKWVQVTGVSDLQAAGYRVACKAFADVDWSFAYFNVSGAGWKSEFFAAPVRQAPLGGYPASDSVYVLIPANVGTTFPFCVKCQGVKE